MKLYMKAKVNTPPFIFFSCAETHFQFQGSIPLQGEASETSPAPEDKGIAHPSGLLWNVHFFFPRIQ
jgi:hypothetical protein